MTPPPALGAAVAAIADDPGGADAPGGRAQVIDELRSRIRGMQKRSLEARVLPTSSALADLLPGGALAAGSSYAVENSTTLALEMLAGPSGAGSWCAIVGMPDLGAEAAAEAGIDLARLVLVPHPGDQWMAVVSALVDVIPVVLVNPPMRDGRARVNDAAASRMAARLRQREAVLIGVGDWPGAEARLRVAESGWSGIGAGFGRLAARRVTVASASAAWAGRGRSRRLWMPGADGRVAAVTPWGAEEAVGPGAGTGAGAAGSGVVPLSAAG